MQTYIVYYKSKWSIKEKINNDFLEETCVMYLALIGLQYFQAKKVPLACYIYCPFSPCWIRVAFYLGSLKLCGSGSVVSLEGVFAQTTQRLIFLQARLALQR